MAGTFGRPNHCHSFYQQLGRHLPTIGNLGRETDGSVTSISSMMTVLVLAMLLGASELTAFSSCPLDVPTKITSNLEPSGVDT